MKQVDSIDGVISTNPSIFGDNRGKFAELQTTRIEFGYNFHPLQTAISISKKGVLRGMHYHKEFKQNQLVTVIEGEIIDVVLDMRKGSKTFGNHCKFHLSSDNFDQVFMPLGTAHGFYAISDTVKLIYHVDQLYDVSMEAGINCLDGYLDIQWPTDDFTMSERDKCFPSFTDIVT